MSPVLSTVASSPPAGRAAGTASRTTRRCAAARGMPHKHPFPAGNVRDQTPPVAPGTTPTSPTPVSSPAPARASAAFGVSAPVALAPGTPSAVPPAVASATMSPSAPKPASLPAPSPVSGVATAEALAIGPSRGVAGSASSAAGEFPLVTRILFDADGVAKKGKDMYAMCGADIYLLPVKGRGRTGKPQFFVDFRGAVSIQLRRLPADCGNDDVEEAISLFQENRRGGRAVRIAGAAQIGADAVDAVFVLDSNQTALAWIESLRSRVTPWTLCQAQMEDACRAEGAIPRERLAELRDTLRKDLKEFSGRGGEDTSSDRDLELGERWSKQWVRRMSRGAKFSSVVNTVAPGAAALAKASDVGDQLSRALGGVALVGPVFSVAALFLRCAELVGQAKEDRSALGAVYQRLPSVSRRLFLAVYSILSSGAVMPDVVDSVFRAIEQCWVVMCESERHLMRSRRDQVWLTENADKIGQAVDNVDVQLQFAWHAEVEAENQRRIEFLERKVQEQHREFVADTSRNEALSSIYSGPGKPKNIVREAILQYAEVLTSVCSGGLVSLADSQSEAALTETSRVEGECEYPSAPIVAVEGAGGYGKTTTLLLLAHDREVRKHFKRIFFVELGVDASDALVVEKLVHIAKVIGEDSVAEKLRALPAGETRVQNAVDFLKPPLASTEVLLILDNVWPRDAERQWAEELSELVARPGSAVLMSTRQEELAEFAGAGMRFSFGRVESLYAARCILELHASLEPGTAEPTKPSGTVVLDEDLVSYAFVVDFILKTCDGWPLALAMCGALIRASGYQWQMIGEKLRCSLVDVKSAKRHVQHAGLQAVLQTNIRFAQNLPVDHSLLLKLGSERRRSEFLSRVNFSDTYMSLAVLDSSRSIPFYVLGALFGVSGEEGEVIGRIFASTGLATLKVSFSDDVGGTRGQRLELILHDIQHAFAEWLCVDSGSSVAKQHEMLLRSSAKRFVRDGDVSDPSFDWSALCDHPDCGKGKETLATYVCDGLARHLLASCSDVAENSRCSRILGLLCSYKWIRGRGAAFDRRALLQDFATALKGLASVCPGGESETTKEERNKVSLFHGELLALETIAEVLQRVHAQRFVLDYRCEAHGAHDSGLAGQLYGRLSVVKFKGLDAPARRNAVHVVFTLLDNIRENVRPPWLLPRSECFGSVERKDARCFVGFAAGEGIVNGLAYLRLGGADVLVSGDQDKVIRLHVICASVRLLHVMSGHEHLVTAVGVADEYGTSAAGSAVIATSSMDGSVRLWRVDAAGSGNYKCTHVLQGSAREMLHCVAITPDARRVVAGGVGNADSDDSVSDTLPDRGEYRVHVWTRHGTTPGPGATVDALEYVTLALDGHTADVSGVQVSRDGERLVSGSSDGTVRVWHLPPSAAPAAADLGVGSSSVVDLRAATPEYDDDKVNALSLTEDSRIAFAGMLRGSIHVIDCNSGSVEASLLTERTGGSNVSCLTLIELNSNSKNSGGGVHGRLFAGHVNGVISEWDLKLRMCVAVYGDPRSGSGAIHSIAARLVPTAGGPGGENGGRSATGGSAAGDGGDGRSGGLGSAESVIEFATGYYDGSARVWRVGDGKGDDGVEERDLSADLLSLKDSAAGCTSVPKRHIDIPGHTPSCISASADGRWVVSGSFKGMLCVWDLDNGRCVATLVGHEAAIVCAGISDCGLIVVSCSLDSTVRIWNSKNRCWPLPIVLRHDRMATCAVLAADGSRIITGDLSGVVRVWDTMTGELYGPALRQHARAITTLAAECSLSKTGDRDRRGHDGNVTSETNWMANFKRLVGFGPQYPSTGLNFASRDAGGTCRLWRWPVENPVKSSSEIPFEQSLRKVFDDELDLSEPGCWQEQRYWWIDKPTKFRLSASAEARSAGCVVSYGVRNDRMMGVLPFAPPREGCECVLCVELDSEIQYPTLYAFERCEGGMLKAIVCCGLLDGTVAMFELVRRPEQASAQHS